MRVADVQVITRSVRHLLAVQGSSGRHWINTFGRIISEEGEQSVLSVTVQDCPASPKGCFASRRGRYAAGLVSHGLGISGYWQGQTAELIHYSIGDTPSWAATHTSTAGQWDDLCPRPVPVGGALAVRYLGADMCGC
jgi:hypothetical protein